MKRFFSNWFLSAALALSLFFIVVGSQWATVEKYGSDMPNWDQWDAECLYLLAPWFEHDHFVEHLFHPHNEHRVVMTKLQNLALTILDDQWDARLECVCNAFVHVALAVAFWLMGRRLVAPKRSEGGWLGVAQASSLHSPGAGWKPALLSAALFAVIAALFATPFAWQNTLGGFHSQQYWLLLLSFFAMVALPFARAWSAGWFFGAFAAALSLLTMGSGFFAAAMIFCLVAFRVARRETTLRAAWPTLAFMFVLVVVGWLTRVEVYYHEELKAKTAQDFFLSIVHSLQWPAPRAYSWLAVVLWLPWLLVTWGFARAKTDSRPVLFIVAFGGWTFAQILATAYARGAGGDYPASRYMDTLAFGTAANALALGWLLSRPKAGDQRTKGPKDQGTSRFDSGPAVLWSFGRLVVWSFALSWLGVFAWGINNLTRLAIDVEMPDSKRYYVKAEAHMRGYLTTKDPAQLEFEDIPYPGPASLIARLNHPSIGSRMPVNIRAPLAMTPAAADPIFIKNFATPLNLNIAPRAGLSPKTGALPSLTSWGSFGSGGPGATGEWSSAPLTAPLNGWLKIETAGDVGRDGVALELRDAKSNALLTTVAPTKVPGDAWRAAYVRAPRGPFVVVARDESTSRWMAFSAPVEMGKLSYFAWRCTMNGALVAELAAGAAVLLWLATLVVGRVSNPPSEQKNIF